LQGSVYTRDGNNEALLAKLEKLSRAEFVALCTISNRSDARYVPSECLLYFVRASRAENSETHFERLYRILVDRVLRALPRAESREGVIVQESLSKSRIREKAFDRFVALLAADRQEYSEKLDYFEVRFDGAVANLRRDAQEQVWREENRKTTIEFDPETNEPSAEVENAVGTFDPFGESDLGDADYRSRLDAAIDRLPAEQIRIIHMLRRGIQIDSKDPNVVTIAKALKKSEKTIRLHRDRAFAALRAATSGEADR
jgi:hypothetical protein